MKTIFQHAMKDGSISEIYGNGEFFIELTLSADVHRLPLYRVDRKTPDERSLYCGYTADQVLSSGRDLIGEHLMRDGDPLWSEVAEALPPLSKNTYTVLGGSASAAGITVGSDGTVYCQSTGRCRGESAIFSPSEYDRELGAITPYQKLTGDEYPVMLSVHTNGERTLECLYFTEPNEPDAEPIVWIRIKRYENVSPESCTLEYRVAAIAREAESDELFDSQPSEEIFIDALYDTLAYWIEYSSEGADFDLPERELTIIGRAASAFAAITFTCEHAHYGHRFYGRALHDNFPPNYISALEALICLGRQAEARRIFSHFIRYVLRRDGRINYRQGTGLNFGASATEYGMLLHIFAKYRTILGIDGLSEREIKKLRGMGDELLKNLSECDEADGLKLIKMCAEADTNERVHIYLNNNLWAIRGLDALASLLGESGAVYSSAAKALRESVCTVTEKLAVCNTRFGDLIPFRVGYTATPATLSRCKDTFYPLTEAESESYFGSAWRRGDGGEREDLIENTYANYRYYPEMLSAMLLPARYADAIVRMREGIGGEIAAMTRFLGHVDDWPVLSYARFLMETGRTEKYLLLLFAHGAHHGDPRLMTYYEQVSIDGAAVANDCTPSLLIVPAMLAWCFVYEGIDGKSLDLLSALPKDWYGKPFAARGIGYSGGVVDTVSDGKSIRIDIGGVPTVPIRLILRGTDSISEEAVTVGKERIISIENNTVIFSSDVGHIEINLLYPDNK